MRFIEIGLAASVGCLVAVGVAHAQDQSQPLAVVNGKTITSTDVEGKLGAALAKLQEQIYTLKNAQLETLIEQQLLDGEASRRGITTAALSDAEINSRIQPATTAEALTFFEANKAKLQGGEFAALQEQIKTYLTSQRLTQRRQEFVKSLREHASINVFLAPPPPFRSEVSIAAAPVRGVATAPVTIVEFSDFHCPFCRKVHPVLEQLLARYGDRVRLVFKDFPLDSLHPNARAAAEAAQCATEQGKFWEFHDKVFTSDPDVSPKTLDRFAGEVGINVGTFDACRTSRKYKTQVDANVREGTQLGVTGTPTFFINGRNLTGAQPIEAFAKVIDEELTRGGSAASGQPRQ